MRELENCIKRAVIMADGNQITLDDIGLNQKHGDEDELNLNLDLRQVREAAEKRAIISALARSDGNVRQGRRNARRQPADALRPDAPFRPQVNRRGRSVTGTFRASLQAISWPGDQQRHFRNFQH